MNGLTDPAEMRAHLVPRPDLPETIQIFARDLYLLWDRVQTDAADDRAFLVSPEGLRLIDSYVYSAPAAYGRLAQEKNGQNLQIEDMLRIATLQKELHEALQKLGITPIIPAQGDPFDPKRHDAEEADAIWVEDRSLHNTIVTVKRCGYADGDRVLRRAQVKRRLCGTPDIASTSGPVDYAIQSDQQHQTKIEEFQAEILRLRTQIDAQSRALADAQAATEIEARMKARIERLQIDNEALRRQLQAAISAQNETESKAQFESQARINAQTRTESLQKEIDALRDQMTTLTEAQSRPTASAPYPVAAPEPPITPVTPLGHPQAPVPQIAQTDDEDLLGTAG